MAVTALEKLSGKTNDRIRVYFIGLRFNGKRERRKNREKEQREGKEIGEPAGIAVFMSSKHGCFWHMVCSVSLCC